MGTVTALRAVEQKTWIPDLLELEGQPKAIAPQDEGDLRWFFSNPQVTYLGGAGGMGGMLERAAAYSFGLTSCRKCGGGAKRPGTGRAPKDAKVSYGTALAAYRKAQRADFCIVTINAWPQDDEAKGINAAAARSALVSAFKAQGKAVMTEGEFREAFPDLPDEHTRSCPACKGQGVMHRRAKSHAEVTAWPTGSSKQLGGRDRDGAEALEKKAAEGGWMRDGTSEVNLDGLERYTLISKALADAEALAPLARAALEHWYSRDIEEFAALVPAGQANGVLDLKDFMGRVWNLVAWGAQ